MGAGGWKGVEEEKGRDSGGTDADHSGQLFGAESAFESYGPEDSPARILRVE